MNLDEYAPTEDRGVSWRRLLAALARHKWLVLLLTLAGLAGGFGISRLIQPEYQARATIWVESSGGDTQGPIRPDELLQASAWVSLLRSNAVLDHVVREERLFLSTESPGDSAVLTTLRLAPQFRPGSYVLEVDESGERYTLSAEDVGVVQQGRVGDAVGDSVGFVWVPSAEALSAGRTIEFDVTTPGNAAMGLAKDLEAQIDPVGNFLQISLASDDPQQAAAVVNAVAARFIDVAADLKGAKLEELTRILGEQLEYAGTNLREAEMGLENFRVETATLPSDRAAPVPGGLMVTRDPVFSGFFQLRVELDQAQRDREAIQRAIARSDDSDVALAALEMIPAVQSSTELNQALQDLAIRRAELRALQRKYTDEHPSVVRAQREINILQDETVPNLASALSRQLASREAEIQQNISSASAELREIPTRAIDEQRLERQVASAATLYNSLRQRFEESRLAKASNIPDVRILDEAVVPIQPVNQDGKLQIILIGLAVGLGLGILVALLLDRFDPRLRYPEQVTEEMGLNILGAVPHVGEQRSRLGGEETAPVVEAFREVRLNMVHAYGAAGPLVATITSPGVGDGKSFVASNLALAFADQGYRTLLIDGDIRRGGLHRIFERDRRAGLTDFLAGHAPAEEVIRETAYPTLDLLTSGSRMKDGPELLGSPAMAKLLAELRSQYNVILIDSPPLGAGVDPFALGTLTGNLLLVLRTGNTNRELAEAKLGLLDRLPIRLLGAVLNDVPNRGVYRYYSYLSGYEAHDEIPVEASGAPKQLQGV